MNIRGIVITPMIEVMPNGGINILSTDIDPFNLRKYLLYWDKIDFPTNNIIYIDRLSRDLQFLEHENILKRTDVQFNLMGPISIDARMLIKAQEIAFVENDKKEKGQWSLVQLSGSQYFNNVESKPAIEFELYNCLPVPQKDVPLNDILEFKEKRRDELEELRLHLEDLYQSIINAGDIPRAKNTELSRLELSLRNMDKTMGEFGLAKFVTSLKGSISGAVSTGLKAAGVAELTNHNSYALESFAAGAFLDFTIKSLLSPKTPNGNPLVYTNSIKKEFSSLI